MFLVQTVFLKQQQQQHNISSYSVTYNNQDLWKVAKDSPFQYNWDAGQSFLRFYLWVLPVGFLFLLHSHWQWVDHLCQRLWIRKEGHEQGITILMLPKVEPYTKFIYRTFTLKDCLLSVASSIVWNVLYLNSLIILLKTRSMKYEGPGWHL